jgi:LEA14-like dessication related protein
VIQDSYKHPINIKSKGQAQIEMPMEILTKPMAAVLKYFDDKKIDSANYSIKARFMMKVPIAGEKDFAMNFSKKLPAVRLPKVKVKDVDLNGLRLKKKGVDMVVEVSNPNKFPLKMKDGNFSFTLDNGLVMAGTMEEIVNIPQMGTGDISMNAKVTEGKVLKAGWDVLTDKKNTHYTMNFNCKMISENKALSDSKMNTNMQGTVAELIDDVKQLK